MDIFAAMNNVNKNESQSLAPVLMVSAIASGQGKTSTTAAIARHFVRAGKRVRVFKTGADFIDPMMLERACGAPVYSLDLWLLGLPACRALLLQAAKEADLVLIEGVMGLYDGQPSSADLANAFGVPVLAVVDASAMAQTVGAVVLGLRDFGPVALAGVIANRVASEGHVSMIRNALREIPLLGSLAKQSQSLPERHLGLVLPAEQSSIEDMLDQLATSLVLDEILWAQLPAASFSVESNDAQAAALPQLLQGRQIAIAKDAAFAFVYPANIVCLEQMGARIVYFSPLNDEAIPEHSDALYLPGGYPELHAARLVNAQQWLASLHAFHGTHRPIYAECGGMMSLAECLVDAEGNEHTMAGLLPGTMRMQKRLTALGMQRFPFGEVSDEGAMLRGHTFHYSRFETSLQPVRHCVRQKSEEQGEAVYQRGSLIATYFHAYFPSNPTRAASLFLESVLLTEAL